MKMIKTMGLVFLFIMLFGVVAYAYERPSWGFGAGASSDYIHIDSRVRNDDRNSSTYSSGVRLNSSRAEFNPYSEGDEIGILVVRRLNRNVRIFEGETMRNMDFGAGRFTFTGLHGGNIGLIGHNRGRTNGFFSFVRQLRIGDIISIEIGGIIRYYEVFRLTTISETDFSYLHDFGDNRLTLITCVEYRPRERRVAVALRVE